MFKEFRDFISKGSAMDLAIGIIIGGAFQKIVTSLVSDIIMPCISMLIGKVDFADMVFTIGGASIKYGNFITAVVDFLIISFVIFLIIRYIDKLKKRSSNNLNKIADKIEKLDKKGRLKKLKGKNNDEEKEEPETKICPYCLTEIKYKATRCPNCTSELDISETSNDSVSDEDVSENEK